MSILNTIIGTPMGILMLLCYNLIHDYGFAIILFTLLTKIILYPLNIMIQKNSIKMIKIQPELNEISAKYINDPDRVSDEQFKLYKRENYKPLAGLIPMMIQIPLVLGVMQVIYHPLQHLLHLPDSTINALSTRAMELLNLTEARNTIQVKVISLIQNPNFADSFRNLNIPERELNDAITQIQAFKTHFFGIDLSVTPSISQWNIVLVVPIIAAFSSWLLCFCQNHVNVLQREQGWLGKWGMTIFLVLFSMYFAFVVPAGVGIYWATSNLFAILAMYLVNWMYKPKDYIDYEALEKSKIALAHAKEMEKENKLTSEDKKRAKADYKAFCKDETKRLVFYAEKSGFYKYFKDVIEYILENSDYIIHYVTSDPKDAIFKKSNPKIRPYFINDTRLIPLFMKVDSDIMVMTTPDLNTYHLKRSYVRKDVEYIYMFHGMLSTFMANNKGAFDHFDTIFCVGQHQINELRETESMYHLPEKKLVPFGYSLLDDMLEDYNKTVHEEKQQKEILIAPSWQEDNILLSCIDEILDELLKTDYKITIRPHPEFIKRFSGRIGEIVDKYGNNKHNNLNIQLDFSSNNTVFDADLLVTDWSGIAYEYSYVTKKPSLFINTKMKVLNEDYVKYSSEPLDILLRNKIGKSLEKDELKAIIPTVEQLLKDEKDAYVKQIEELVQKYVFHVGESGKIGGQYIIEQLDNRKPFY